MYSKRQIQIIDESIQIIDEKGIQGLTIKNLSKAIGISEPAIYRYFDSKIDILTALLQSYQLEMAAKIRKTANEKSNNSMEKIEAICNLIIDKLSVNPALVSVIFSEELFVNEKLLSTIVFEIFKAKESVMINIISQGQVKGEIKNDIDPKMLSLIVLGSLRMLIKKWKMNDHNFNLQTEGKKIILCLKNLIIN